MNAEAIRHLCAADKILARVIRQVGACTLKPKRRRSPFEALVTAVTHQQLNGAAAMTILKRVLALYPGRRFPTPEDLLATPDEKLRAAGLSRAKIAAVKDIAEKTVSGVVPTLRQVARMSDAELIERLTVVRGVGPWTVEMFLMFTLGRQDVLPVTDFGVRKGFSVVYGLADLPTPKELLAHGERWRPHRTTAAWYLWRALELPKQGG
ncbi:MAG: DNA-3-methyladenine glycosylase [Verrucomicrobiota bacterium]